MAVGLVVTSSSRVDSWSASGHLVWSSTRVGSLIALLPAISGVHQLRKGKCEPPGWMVSGR